MDAVNMLKGLSGLSKTHPVTMPDFIIGYEKKDITLAIKPYLISISYTDYLGEQSDELSVSFEDTDGRWLRNWYPEQGDLLSFSLGDQFTGLVNLGNFEIADIDYAFKPNVITLKALSTGITSASRTLQPKAYEKTTLEKIVQTVAARLQLVVKNPIAKLEIERITQYQESDVEFLARLAKQFGYTFKIVDKTLAFIANTELTAQEPVMELLPEDIESASFRDQIKGVPNEVVASGYDPKAKQVRTVKRKGQPLRPQSKQGASGDQLKIVANKGESHQQLAARADAALADARKCQVTGSLGLFGNVKLVAGQIIRLRGYGKMSGNYQIKQASHNLSRSSGYVTSLEINMIEYIADDADGDKHAETV